LTSDPANCGECGNKCPPVSHAAARCKDSKCGFQCNDNNAQCSDKCVDTQNDVANCGQCNKACGPVQGGTSVCSLGQCGVVCDAGLSQCGGACVDTRSDSKNCGHCGKICSGKKQTCQHGQCGGDNGQ
jgi:hypothetical protein